MIYCPRCGKRITPDHRCLNRRHFFGMLAGAAALLVAPDPFLRPGDHLSVSFTSSPDFAVTMAILETIRPKLNYFLGERSAPIGIRLGVRR